MAVSRHPVPEPSRLIPLSKHKFHIIVKYTCRIQMNMLAPAKTPCAENNQSKAKQICQKQRTPAKSQPAHQRIAFLFQPRRIDISDKSVCQMNQQVAHSQSDETIPTFFPGFQKIRIAARIKIIIVTTILPTYIFISRPPTWRTATEPPHNNCRTAFGQSAPDHSRQSGPPVPHRRYSHCPESDIRWHC